ncbi:hypothetical protein AX15_003707 [Amanita polypyramis BW_CC]|nr:hypothetical protein AX15_003707 [Amanita polypyramis BW_CC]
MIPYPLLTGQRRVDMLRDNLKVPFIIGICALSLYAVHSHFGLFGAPLIYLNYFTPQSASQLTTTGMSSHHQLRGWHSRALRAPRPNPHSFTPDRERLKLALLGNTPVEPKGFSLAIFSQPNDKGYVVVDALGRVLELSSSSPDIHGLLSIGLQTLDLPIADEFRNTWIIKHPWTDMPIDRFYFIGESETRETSVYGYSPTRTELQFPVEGYTHLPHVLVELFGLVLEAREGYRAGIGGGNADHVVVEKVKEALEDLY